MRGISRTRTPFSESDLLSLDDRIVEQTKQVEHGSNSLHSLHAQKEVEVNKSAFDIPALYDKSGNLLALDEATLDKQILGLEHDKAIMDLISKSSENIVPSFYAGGEVYIATKEEDDVTDTKGIRRAIHTISNYYNTLGIFRDDFDKTLNDKMARNAYYAIGEKAIMDYFGTIEWTVKDTKDGSKVEKAIEFLRWPNPQDSFDDIKKQVIRDTIRYDAGTIVKTFNKGGYLHEMKAYLGTEFWREQDRVPLIINVPIQTAVNLKGNNRGKYFDSSYPTYQGWWSHGYTERFWQRSRTGVYIPFQPEEICYFMMYPRTDGIYGTDFLKYLRYQMQYLIESTKAAGKTFENGMVPSLVWEHPDMRSASQLRMRILEAKFNNQGAGKFGSVLHAVNGEKIHTLAQNLHDMQWLEGQKFVAQLIWAMWGFSQDEFLGGGANRATAYVKRNITKSRMLYPLMDYFEQKVNREILPYLKGYKKSWKFEFLKDVDLDDQQKITQINAVKASIMSQYLDRNFPVEVALKLAGVGDDLTTDEVETITETLTAIQRQQMEMQVAQAQQSNMQANQQTGGTTGMPEDGEVGRYDGENAGTAGYSPINFSDYGLGGEGTETRTGEADEKAFKKAEIMEVQGADGVTRMCPCAFYNVETKNGIVTKAKVYINSPGEAPHGRSVKRGNRGAYYYITSEAKQSSGPTAGGEQPSRKPRRGWSNSQQSGPDTTSSGGGMSDPSGGSGEPASLSARISGKGVGVVIQVANGQLIGEMSNTEQSSNFLQYVANEAKGETEAVKIFEIMVNFAKESGLEVS